MEQRLLLWVHYELITTRLFRDEGRFDDAHTHIERVKSHTVNSAYNLGHARPMFTKGLGLRRTRKTVDSSSGI